MFGVTGRWSQIGSMASGDGLRAYLRRLREGRDVTQETLAEAMEFSRRALLDWESGATKSLKTRQLIRAVRTLNASLEDIDYLVDSDASAEEGVQRATAWLMQSGGSQLPALIENDPESVLDATRELRELRQRVDNLEQRLLRRPVSGTNGGVR